MKKVFLLASITVSFLTAVRAQVDPAFTDKVVMLINTAKEYYEADEIDKPTKLEKAYQAVWAFRIYTEVQYASKLSAMLNSPTEMAKLSGPIGFAQCLGVAAQNYVYCINHNAPFYPAPGGSGDESGWTDYGPCNNTYANSIVACGIIHLVHY